VTGKALITENSPEEEVVTGRAPITETSP
jgi:hypothetical protein